MSFKDSEDVEPIVIEEPGRKKLQSVKVSLPPTGIAETITLSVRDKCLGTFIVSMLPLKFLSNAHLKSLFDECIQSVILEMSKIDHLTIDSRYDSVHHLRAIFHDNDDNKQQQQQ